MFAVFYRWRVLAGREPSFREGWRSVTEAIRRTHGSLGSRLHRTGDGGWAAYAEWPSRAAWEHAFAQPPADPAGSALVRAAVAERFEPIELEVTDDLLARTEAPRVRPIGTVRSSRTEPTDDGWSVERSAIELDPSAVDPDALAGLDGFSHVEIIYLFHRVADSAVERGARHPRENTAWPRTGILAQRAKVRPNRLGLSRARIERVDGLRLELADFDALDGAPVLDVKPWVQEMAPRGEIRQPPWATELMRGYF
jgi:tRNA (Thr-GGU) A37 N-methylase/heme-degrading monooxygenase HmoA